MASAQFAKVLDIIQSQPRNPNATVGQMRGGMEKVSERVAPDVTCEAVRVGDMAAEWITPPGAAADRAILYLHGGGYVMGSINTHRAMVARIARAAQARALLIDYRLAPEHPFPAAVDDAAGAYRWMLSQGCKPARLTIAGDSAGGGLVLAALIALRDSGAPLPAAAVAISPWTDMEGTGNSVTSRAAKDPIVQKDGLLSMGKMYVGQSDPKNPLASPVHANFQGLPPLLIQVGEAEILVDDSTRVAERAKAAGVKADLEIWPEMVHVWHIFAKLLPEGQQAIDKIGTFILAHTS